MPLTHTSFTHLDEENGERQFIYLSRPTKAPRASTSTPHYALIGLINLGELFN